MSRGREESIAREVDALRAAVEGEAWATETALDAGAFQDARRGAELPGHDELCRQLTALRHRVDRAPAATESPGELRAELATLLSFAQTLRADAAVWRAGVRLAVAELERHEVAARQERERLAAEQAELLRRRVALQSKIDQEAVRIADSKRGECRRTLPVITLHPGLTVSSMTVSRTRRHFRSVKLWLVTLDDTGHDVLVRPD